MNKITKEKAEAILKEHYSNFVSAMRDAKDEAIKLVRDYPDTTPRTKSNFINDRMRSNIRVQYQNDTSCKILEPRGSFFLRIQNVIAARFKKLNNSRPSNIVTKHSTQIEMQQLCLGENMESPTIINVGYIPNKAADIWQYEISCLMGKEILWTVDITPEVEAIQPVEIPESDLLRQPEKVKRVHKKAQ